MNMDCADSTAKPSDTEPAAQEDPVSSEEKNPASSEETPASPPPESPDVEIRSVKNVEELVRVEGRLVLHDLRKMDSPEELVLPNLEYVGSIRVGMGFTTIKMPKLLEISGQGKGQKLGMMVGLYAESTSSSYQLVSMEAPLLKKVAGSVMFCACPKLEALDFPEAVDVPDTDDISFYGCNKLNQKTLWKEGAAALAAARAN